MTDTHIEQLELMTPGSLWLKDIKGRTTISTFLFFANQGVPRKFRHVVPVKAVFADQEGMIYALDVDEFLEGRTFHSVNPDVEWNVENIFNPRLEEYPAEESLDHDGDDLSDSSEIVAGTSSEEELMIVEDDEEDAVTTPHITTLTASSQGQTSTEQSPRHIDIQYHLTALGDQEPVQVPSTPITVEELRKLTVAYEQRPSLTKEGMWAVEHCLTVDTSEVNLGADELMEFFRPSEDHLFYGAFTVDGISVDWDGILGVFSQTKVGKSYLKIFFTTDPHLPEEAPAVETLEEDKVEASAQEITEETVVAEVESTPEEPVSNDVETEPDTTPTPISVDDKGNLIVSPTNV